ncbi:hypothetical protein ACFXDJ_06540 [Streptomyces sp. NPDC059443]|uniref:hypothetical protein n=1 Tax=unclassified Streptomyces TaxID=2593676 RepID=UPI0036C87EE4
MGAMAVRLVAATALALLLMPPAGNAFAARTADPPAPSPPVGAQLSARPGERLTFTEASYLVGMNGNWVSSEIFIEHGTLRMNDPLITAVATVACDTPSGIYEVERTGPGGPAKGAKGEVWVTVKVEDITEAEREACPGKVAALPQEQPDERWPVGDSWPQSSWDVRTFKPGDEVTPTGSDADLGYGNTLTSPGFTGRPVMSGKKAVLTATAVIRCEAVPGLYEVRWVGRDEVWARYRVAPIDEAARLSCRDQVAEPAAKAAKGRASWLVGGAAVAAAGAGTYVLARRRRRTFR